MSDVSTRQADLASPRPAGRGNWDQLSPPASSRAPPSRPNRKAAEGSVAEIMLVYWAHLSHVWLWFGCVHETRIGLD